MAWISYNRAALEGRAAESMYSTSGGGQLHPMGPLFRWR